MTRLSELLPNLISSVALRRERRNSVALNKEDSRKKKENKLKSQRNRGSSNCSFRDKGLYLRSSKLESRARSLKRNVMSINLTLKEHKFFLKSCRGQKPGDNSKFWPNRRRPICDVNFWDNLDCKNNKKRKIKKVTKS